MRAAWLIGVLGFAFLSIATAQAAMASSGPFVQQAGTLDASFGQGGKVVTNFYGVPTDAQIQADGKIDVVGGPGVARFLSNGSIDMSFGHGGAAALSFAAAAMAIQPDLKLVVAGSVVNTYGEQIEAAVARLNPDGSPDSTFGSGGVVTMTFVSGAFSSGDVVTLQPDGKILLGGLAKTGGCLRTTYTAIARLNTDGTFDSSFGSNGIATVLALFGQNVDALALQTDAKILALGDGMNVARFMPNGTLDGSIMGGTISSIAYVGTSTFEPGGKVVYGSNYYEQNDYDWDLQPQRYLRGGSADPNFHGPIIDYGRTAPSQDIVVDAPYAIAVEPNGKLLVGGISQAPDGSSRFGLARFDHTGSLDATFGGGGRLTTMFMRHAELTALAVQPDAKIVAVGATSGAAQNAPNHITLARYLGP